MAYTIPSLDRLHDFVIACMRALFPDQPWSRFSDGWKWFRGVSLAVTEVNAHVNAIRRDLFPTTASEAALGEWAKLRRVYRKEATPARKPNALRITGTAGSAVAVGNELVHEPTGLRFQINEAEVIPVSPTWVDVDVLALDTGRQTQLSAGEILRFIAPPAGVNEEGTLQLDLDEGGDDREELGAWRARIVESFGKPALGGAQNDYVTWAKEITGIAEAYAYPGRAGKGTVDVAALHLGRGTDRLLAAGERTALRDYLLTKIPAMNVSALRVLEVLAQPADVEITLTAYAGATYAFDWDDSTAPTVSAWNAGTRTLSLSARPASLAAGHRIVFRDITVPPVDDGRQYTVEALSGSLDVILEAAPIFTPAVGDVVYSGGVLVDPVRDAVLAHLDELGTANPDDASYGAWEANLRVENLYRIVQGIAGVRRSSVVTPADTVEAVDPEYPDDDTIYLITPRRVLVRRG